MTITINFEIPVATTGYPRRARNQKIITAHLTRAIDVAIIDADEAPIAATLPDGKLRARKGAFFQSADDVPQAGAIHHIPPWSASRLIDMTDYRQVYRGLLRTVGLDRDFDVDHPAGTVDLSGFGIRELDEESIQSQLDAFADRSDDLIVVENVLYRKTKRPLISIGHGRYRYATTLMVDLLSDDDEFLSDIIEGSRNSFGIYSLADHELAIERCRNLAETYEWPCRLEHCRVIVHRPDLLETDTTAFNAAIFAHSFLGNFFAMQMSRADRDGLADLINLGTDRMRQVLKFADGLKVYCEKGHAASLKDASAYIVERPDSDPLWAACPSALIEHRDFLRSCLDGETVMLDPDWPA